MRPHAPIGRAARRAVDHPADPRPPRRHAPRWYGRARTARRPLSAKVRRRRGRDTWQPDGQTPGRSAQITDIDLEYDGHAGIDRFADLRRPGSPRELPTRRHSFRFHHTHRLPLLDRNNVTMLYLTYPLRIPIFKGHKETGDGEVSSFGEAFSRRGSGLPLC